MIHFRDDDFTPEPEDTPHTSNSDAQQGPRVTAEETAARKEKVLDTFLDLVPLDGWCAQTLENAAQKCGLEPLDAWALFPNKEKDALATWNRALDFDMQEKLKTLDLEGMKIRERIFWAVRTRLNLLEPRKDAAEKALKFLLCPTNTSMTLPLLYDTVHLMWVMAGDTATDYNFYTKRFLLSGVYVSTFFYWLKDTSPEHHKSWSFLEKRIENVLALQKLKSWTAGGERSFTNLFKFFWPFS